VAAAAPATLQAGSHSELRIARHRLLAFFLLVYSIHTHGHNNNNIYVHILAYCLGVLSSIEPTIYGGWRREREKRHTDRQTDRTWVKINRQHARYIEKKRKKRFARINMTSFVLYTAQTWVGLIRILFFPPIIYIPTISRNCFLSGFWYERETFRFTTHVHLWKIKKKKEKKRFFLDVHAVRICFLFYFSTSSRLGSGQPTPFSCLFSGKEKWKF
jgi:hypothetical protein